MSPARDDEELGRAHDRDMAARVNRLAPLLHGSLFLSAASLWPLLGLPTVGVFVVLSMGFRALDPDFPPFARSEALRPGIAFCALMLGVACVLTGGPHSPLVPLFAMPAVAAAAHIRGRRLLYVLGAIEACIVGVSLSRGLEVLLDDPARLIVPTALLTMVSIVVSSLAASDSEHRSAATLDPLTGMLNRHGLAARFSELAAQARRSGRPISLAVVDVDVFKSVNDEHGHRRGDEVLLGIAATLSANLRPFELAYRIGGDEFLIVLPGLSLAEAVQVGDRLREKIRDAKPGGLPITVSIGVSSAQGEDLTYETLFAQSDAALYRAKLAGRDRVEADREPERPRAAAA